MPQYKKIHDGTLSNGHYTITIEDGGYVSIAEELVSKKGYGLTCWGSMPLYDGPIRDLPQSIRQEILASGLSRVG